MAGKTSQLQIRVTAAEKAALRERAGAAGLDVSRYVLARALPPPAAAFAGLMAAMGSAKALSASLIAGLEDLLMPLGSEQFAVAVEAAPGLADAHAVAQNLVAAMVEHAAAWRGVVPPAWTLDVPSLDEPWFATDLRSLRPYLIASSPVPYRRRNLYVERGLGARV